MENYMWILTLLGAFSPVFALGMISGALMAYVPWDSDWTWKERFVFLVPLATIIVSMEWSLGFFGFPDLESALDTYTFIGVLVAMIATVIAMVISWFWGCMFGVYIYDEICGWQYRRKHQ